MLDISGCISHPNDTGTGSWAKDDFYQSRFKLQFFLPGWVRAHGLAVYQVVFFGAQAAGAVAWGLIAGRLGLIVAFLVAAAVMAAGAIA